MRRIVVLGSTGSIGTQTLDVARRHPDKLEVVALAAARAGTSCWRRRGSSACATWRWATSAWRRSRGRRPGRRRAAAGTGRGAPRRWPRLSARAAGGERRSGSVPSGGGSCAPEADVVVNALVGAAGLRASYETLAAGKVLALANKESLVVGGDLIMPLAAQVDAQPPGGGLGPGPGPAGALMPIDSEHGAIYQCLLGEDAREVARLWVTASGGPFRGRTRAELADITPAQALAHPTWNMGAKISIDSSTLMNKGLEVIEAHHLFAMPYDRISVVVQPQSAIHSMVEFADGSVKAHLGTTDMRIPIQFALSYPERWDAPVAPLDFRTLGRSSSLRPTRTRSAAWRLRAMRAAGRHAALRHERRERGGGCGVSGRRGQLSGHRRVRGGRHGIARARRRPTGGKPRSSGGTGRLGPRQGPSEPALAARRAAGARRLRSPGCRPLFPAFAPPAAGWRAPLSAPLRGPP